MAPAPAAMLAGPVPTLICAMSLVTGSTLRTAPADSLLTHTAPLPKATSAGRTEMAIRRVSAPVVSSTWAMSCPSAFATHSEPPPTATAEGPSPTGIV